MAIEVAGVETRAKNVPTSASEELALAFQEALDTTHAAVACEVNLREARKRQEKALAVWEQTLRKVQEGLKRSMQAPPDAEAIRSDLEMAAKQPAWSHNGTS